ncbi:hypothetical protein ACH3VR_22135 [Microbacterium sp. B2969]|uniref:Uncharacterized protein n=1 Tax=Microbacterium alkaliflavum TaxID=3248839 RepID=A0ABW7QFD2_9MICO
MVVFTEPLRVVPLGYTTRTGARITLTIGDRPGSTKQEYSISRDVDEYLTSIDIRALYRDLSEADRDLLAALHDSNIVAVCPISHGLTVVPFTRRPLSLAEHLGADCIVRFDDAGEKVIVSETGGRILRLIDGDRTLQQLADEVEHTSAPTAAVDVLAEAASLAQTMRAVGALTFEPAS